LRAHRFGALQIEPGVTRRSIGGFHRRLRRRFLIFERRGAFAPHREGLEISRKDECIERLVPHFVLLVFTIHQIALHTRSESAVIGTRHRTDTLVIRNAAGTIGGIIRRPAIGVIAVRGIVRTRIPSEIRIREFSRSYATTIGTRGSNDIRIDFQTARILRELDRHIVIEQDRVSCSGSSSGIRESYRQRARPDGICGITDPKWSARNHEFAADFISHVPRWERTTAAPRATRIAAGRAGGRTCRIVGARDQRLRCECEKNQAQRKFPATFHGVSPVRSCLAANAAGPKSRA
jgi:hypothetical protein